VDQGGVIDPCDQPWYHWCWEKRGISNDKTSLAYTPHRIAGFRLTIENLFPDLLSPNRF
jgi:hypothetical protein